MTVDSPLARVMDNPYYDWSHLTARPRLSWPGGANIALGVMLTLESMTWYSGRGCCPAIDRARLAGSLPEHARHPLDLTMGVRQPRRVFRVLDVLEQHSVVPIVAMDVRVAERSPFLVKRLADLGAEFVGHGLSADQMITEAMSEDEEKALIAETLGRLSAAVGGQVRGWHGSEYAESSRTVRLLAAAGLDYVLDWPNDEQPSAMKVPEGRMLNLPVAVELDDVFADFQHHITAAELRRVSIDYVDRLYADGAETGRLLLLNVHPWLTGQPFRIRYFADVIDYICGRAAIWKATGAEIADWYRSVMTP